MIILSTMTPTVLFEFYNEHAAAKLHFTTEKGKTKGSKKNEVVERYKTTHAEQSLSKNL